jgi:hypothetical protein
MDVSSNPSVCAPLSTSPEAGSSVDPDSKKPNVDGPLQSIKLDELGPMVVNNDGVGFFFPFFAYHCQYYSTHVILLIDAFSNRKLGANEGHGTRKDGSRPFQEEQVNPNSFFQERYWANFIAPPSRTDGLNGLASNKTG